MDAEGTVTTPTSAVAHDPPRLSWTLIPRYDDTATPLDAANHHQATQDHPSPHHDCDTPIYNDRLPGEPPPSYHDATHSSASPLLVGPPPDYGAFRAYVDPDVSSEASTDVDDAEQYLPERIGQAFSILVLVGILFLFWRIITQPDPDHFPHGYA